MVIAIFQMRFSNSSQGRTLLKLKVLLASHDFEKGFNVDTSKWTYIVGEQFDDDEPILDARLFKEMVEAQPEEFRIVRRVCPTCSESHRDIYYKRLESMPDDFDLLDTLMNNWFDKNNTFNVDFALYSTYMDAYYDENRWTFCNFNDPGKFNTFFYTFFLPPFMKIFSFTFSFLR